MSECYKRKLAILRIVFLTSLFSYSKVRSQRETRSIFLQLDRCYIVAYGEQ